MSMTRTLAKDVSQENRDDHPVVQHLQRQVANAFVLYANYKRSTTLQRMSSPRSMNWRSVSE